MEKDNATLVLTRFIKALAIPVTRQSISDELQKHPDYGSLLAFNDVLNNYHVANDAYQVPFNELNEVPLPFISFLTDKTYAVVTQLDEKQATLSNDRWNNKVFPIDQFKRLYGKSILTAQKQVNSGEPGYAEKRRKEILNDWSQPLSITGTAIILLAFFLIHSTWLNALNLQTALLTLFKTAGLITSILLLAHSIDANNPLIQRLCGGDDTKNCNAILTSKAAKVTKGLLLFNSGNMAIMQALAVLNLACLPYTFISIYYQWRVAKQWCLFCCAVQALLWLEFFAFLPYLSRWLSGQIPGLKEWGSVALVMALPVVLWIWGKRYLLKYAELTERARQLRRLKYDKELFDAALRGQPQFATPGADWSIVLGNTEANNIITMISNPYCQPCAKAHTQIDEALNNFEDMQVRIVFMGRKPNEKNAQTPIRRHLMALNELPDKKIIKNALHDWYAQKYKDYDEWAKNYPVEVNDDNNYKLKEQRAWCRLTGITATPTILVSGYLLPETYQLHELKYMLYKSNKEAFTEGKEAYAL